MKKVLGSRRFVSTVVLALLMIFSAWLPQLQSVETELVSFFTTVIVALVAGYTLPELAQAIAPALAALAAKTPTQLDDKAVNILQGKPTAITEGEVLELLKLANQYLTGKFPAAPTVQKE